MISYRYRGANHCPGGNVDDSNGATKIVRDVGEGCSTGASWPTEGKQRQNQPARPEFSFFHDALHKATKSRSHRFVFHIPKFARLRKRRISTPPTATQPSLNGPDSLKDPSPFHPSLARGLGLPIVLNRDRSRKGPCLARDKSGVIKGRDNRKLLG